MSKGLALPEIQEGVEGVVEERSYDIEALVAEDPEAYINVILQDHQDRLVRIIRNFYPDIDIVRRVSMTDPERIREILAEVQTQHPGVKLYYSDVPFCGVHVYRAQTLNDTKAAAQAAVELAQKMVDEKGGREAFQKMNEEERARINADIDNDALDKTNEIILARCVLYPEDFGHKVVEGDLPFGLAPLMLDKINLVSGCMDVVVQEV